VLDHLTEIGNVWIAVPNRDFAIACGSAARSPRICGCSMTSAGAGAAIALTMPSGEVTRAARPPAPRSRHLARQLRLAAQDDEAMAKRGITASDALGELLGQITNHQASHRSDDQEAGS
jgi:hypothetical protein